MFNACVRLLLVNKFYGPRGGAEAVVLQIRRLVEAAGHEVVPFAMRQDGDPSDPWTEFFVPTRSYFEGSLPRRVADTVSTIYSFEARRCLARLLRSARPDVAHLHNVYHQLTLSIVDELRGAGVPTVLTLHDYKAACPNYQLLTHDGLCTRCVGGNYWHAVRHRCLKGSVAGSAVAAAEAYLNRWRRQYEKVDLILTPSAFLRDVVVRAGLPASRVEVLPNAVPIVPEAPAPMPRTAPVFVYFGRLSPEKGLDTLLSAAVELPPGATVRAFGTGPEQGRLARRIERERLPVTLEGFATPDVIATALDAATAAVLPSRWYENCPMSILEAAARGVPTVASDIGGIPELIESGVNSVLVPADDPSALAAALCDLARDPNLARALGAAARGRVRTRHAEDRFRDELLERYERVVRVRAQAG